MYFPLCAFIMFVNACDKKRVWVYGCDCVYVMMMGMCAFAGQLSIIRVGSALLRQVLSPVSHPPCPPRTCIGRLIHNGWNKGRAHVHVATYEVSCVCLQVGPEADCFVLNRTTLSYIYIIHGRVM